MNPLPRIKSFLSRYRPSTVMLILVVSILGFILGFSIALLLKRPSGAAIALPIISAIASIGGFFGVFREFFKDRREERKTPVLENERKPIKKLQHFSTGIQTNYFLRVHKKSGQGIADQCHGFLDMKDYRHKITVWDNFGNTQYAKISTFEDLLLFGVLKNEMRFCSSNEGEGRFMEKPYNQYIEQEIRVDIGAANAKTPPTFIMKVKDIVENAVAYPT
jgi:hypothetical protein